MLQFKKKKGGVVVGITLLVVFTCLFMCLWFSFAFG